MPNLRKYGACLAAAGVVWLGAGAAWAVDAAPAAVTLTPDQMTVLRGLFWLMSLLFLIGALLIFNLQRGAQKLASTSDAARDRYFALPFGVPEGTVRGLVSILIIILGIAVLVVQGPLGIESTEAVAGFVSAVIAFYFVTREQAQTRAMVEQSSRALQETTTALRTSLKQVNLKVDKAADEAKRTEPISRAAVADLAYVAIRDEIEKTFAVYRSDKALDQSPYRYNGPGLRALVLRCESQLKATEYLSPVADLFSLSVDQIVAANLSKTGADLEAAVANDICGDIAKAGGEVVP